MPTLAEVRAQLTGPGGMFEVVTEDVAGRPMQVYAQRMGSLREIVQAAIARGDESTFLVHGDRSYGFRSFVTEANGVARALAADYGIGPGDRVAVLSQNNPEWCLAFWATVSQGAILVGLNGWWKADEVLYGLQDSGATVLVADRKRFERIADRLDEAPDLAHVFLVDADPADFPAPAGVTLHRFDELTGSPSEDFPDGRHRRGRRRRHLLHVGHDREAQGRHLHPPLDDRQPPEHDLEHGRVVDGEPVRRHAVQRPGPHRVAADLAPVPRVGLPLGPGGGDAGRDQDRHPHRALRPGPARWS